MWAYVFGPTTRFRSFVVALFEFSSLFQRGFSLNRYCNSHLQVLGLVPKKSKRKKASESGGGETDHLILAPEQKRKPDVSSASASTNNFSNPAMAFSFRQKRPKVKSQGLTEPKIPAIEELKESRKKMRQDRTDLFTIYGKLHVSSYLSVALCSAGRYKILRFFGTMWISENRV